MSRASTSVHQVASRAAGVEPTRRPGGPWPARGPSRTTRSRSRRTGSGSPRRRRSRRSPGRPRPPSPRSGSGSSARRGRAGRRRARAGRHRRGSSPAGRRARSGPRSRACCAKLRAVSSLSWREPLVVARRVAVDQGEAQGVGPDLVDHLERIDDVAGRLRHLPADRVADHAVEVDRVERRLGP